MMMKSKRGIFCSFIRLFNAVMQEAVIQIIVSCLTDIDSVAESFKVEIMGVLPSINHNRQKNIYIHVHCSAHRKRKMVPVSVFWILTTIRQYVIFIPLPNFIDTNTSNKHYTAHMHNAGLLLII